jgi:hypothetical protein
MKKNNVFFSLFFQLLKNIFLPSNGCDCKPHLYSDIFLMSRKPHLVNMVCYWKT